MLLGRSVLNLATLCQVMNQGRIQRLMKGGGAHIEWSWCVHAARGARRTFPLCISHSVLGGLGAYSPKKLFKFRPYESASEAVGDNHNHAKCLLAMSESLLVCQFSSTEAISTHCHNVSASN